MSGGKDYSRFLTGGSGAPGQSIHLGLSHPPRAQILPWALLAMLLYKWLIYRVPQAEGPGQEMAELLLVTSISLLPLLFFM